MKATVLIRPKEGILDPQGEAVEGSLRKLGFAVVAARVGRLVDVELDIDDLVEVQKLNSFMETDFVNANSESWQESLVCKKDPQAVLPPSDGG